MDAPAHERRSAARYPVALKVSCKRLEHGVAIYAGSGTTRNMSSKGLLVEVDQPLDDGQYVELFIRWPAGRQTMHVLGRVLRCDLEGAAIQILQHAFGPRRGAHSARAARPK